MLKIRNPAALIASSHLPNYLTSHQICNSRLALHYHDKDGMNDYNHKTIRSAVSHTISSYQQTSRSKSLRRLSSKNVDQITKSIIDKKQNKQLLELIKKRDYYTNKIHELLNESGEESDPRFIIEEDEAEHYVRKQLRKDQDKVQQIRDLINKHRLFQETSSKELDHIMKKFVSNRLALGGLKKLEAMTTAIEARVTAEKETELSNFYSRIMRKQYEYSLESENILRNLGVPFFVVASNDYKASRTQKSFILNLLYDIV